MADVRTWSAIVIPCLNEAAYIAATCESLGFDGVSPPPAECHLVLVDNGSTDGTLDYCHMLKADYGSSVVVVREPTRGHVPARHHGNVVSGQMATAFGVSHADTIIIQADADSIYSTEYVNTVREYFQRQSSTGILAQTITRMSSDLRANFPNVFTAIDAVDQAIEARFKTPLYDVIVDDKACAYRLNDYFRWGGHRREYFDDGTEILAETTRLMIAAAAHGDERREVSAASVVHSNRRLFEDATRQLSAAGFPYSNSSPSESGTANLCELERAASSGHTDVLREICTTRAAHLIALMVVLPAHLERTLTGVLSGDPAIERLTTSLPSRSPADLSARPGQSLVDVLDLVRLGSTTLNNLAKQF